MIHMIVLDKLVLTRAITIAQTGVTRNKGKWKTRLMTGSLYSH